MPIYTQSRTRQSLLEEYVSPLADVLGTSAEEALLYSPTSSINRAIGLRNAQDGEPLGIGGDTGDLDLRPTSPLVDADAARSLIREEGLDIAVPDAGIRQDALDILIARKSDERRRMDILNRAPAGIGVGLAQFGVAVGASMLDPLNVASAFIPVVSQARYGQMIARFGAMRGRAAVGAIEGTAGAALVEPIVYGAASFEQADYDLTDSLLNIALGTALGGGLHVVTGAVADVLARQRSRVSGASLEALPRILDEAPFEVREQALRTAVAQAVSGRQIDIEPVLRTSGITGARFGPEMRASIDIESAAPVTLDRAPEQAARPIEVTAYKGMHPYTDEGAVVDPSLGREQYSWYGKGTEIPGMNVSKGNAGFFASNPGVASEFARALSYQGGAVFPVKLRFNNPLVIDGQGRPASEFQFDEANEQWQRYFSDEYAEYDGVVLRNVRDRGGLTDIFVPKRPEQIAPLFREPPKPITTDEARASFAPEAVRLADFDAARAADKKLKEAPAEEKAAEASLETAATDLHETVTAMASPRHTLETATAEEIAIARPSNGEIAYAIKKDGQTVGFVVAKIKGSDAEIRDIYSITGDMANAFGPAAMREVMRDFLAKNPSIKTFSGERVSGARRGGVHGLAGSGVDVSVKVARTPTHGLRSAAMLRENQQDTGASIRHNKAEQADTFDTVMQEVEALAESLGDPDLVTRELREASALAESAETYGKAVRAAANCQLRKGDE